MRVFIILNVENLPFNWIVMICIAVNLRCNKLWMPFINNNVQW